MFNAIAKLLSSYRVTEEQKKSIRESAYVIRIFDFNYEWSFEDFLVYPDKETAIQEFDELVKEKPHEENELFHVGYINGESHCIKSFYRDEEGDEGDDEEDDDDDWDDDL